MEKEKLILQICAQDQKLNLLASRKNYSGSAYDGCSIGKVLTILGNAKEEIHPTMLCKELGVTTPRITTILNEMEKEGLIERQISKTDRRKIILAVTKKGKKAIEEKNKNDYEFFALFTEKAGVKDAEAFYRCMKVYEEICNEMKKKK